MMFRNYTGHHIVVEGDDEATQFLPTHGHARIDSNMDVDEVVEWEGISVPILHVTERKVTGLPEPTEGVLYVVSGLVASHVDRNDCVIPSRVRRNHGGGVDACSAFIRVTKGGR